MVASRSRREFLQQVAGGLAFTTCALTGLSAQRGGPRGRRRIVTLRGRRVTTVDAHAHCLVPEALRLLGKTVNREAQLPMAGQPLEERLAAMDAQGIDVAVLSLVPNWDAAERDLATQVVSLQNEQLAAYCAAHKERFAALASVAMQFPDLAASQLEHAVRTLGLRGVAIATSVAGIPLADPKFHPFWAKAESLDALVFIHPIDMPDPSGRLAGNGALGKVIGHPLETTLALSHLIFEGTLDRFPGVKICAAHGGGFLPSYMHRSDYGCEIFPEQCSAGVPKRQPTEYLRRMYFDSLVFTPEALRHLAAEVGADHIVMGTDFPYPWTSDPAGPVLATPGLTDRDREAILGGTARRLLKLDVRGA